MSQFDPSDSEHDGIRTPSMFQAGSSERGQGVGGWSSAACLVGGVILGAFGWMLLGDTVGGTGETVTGQILVSAGSVLAAIGVIAIGVRIGIREALGNRDTY